MQPIRFIAVGDPHIAKRHLGLSREAMANTLKVVQERAKDIQMVVIMGDILDRHDDAKLTYMRLARDWIVALSKVKLTVVLIGNHDRPSNQDIFSNVHPFMDLQDVDKTLYIVDRPKALAFPRFKPGEPKVGKEQWYVLFMPYLPPGLFQDSFSKYMEKVSKVTGKKPQSMESFDLIFAHQEFKGAPYGPIVSVKGDPWPSTYPFIVSGHIHTRTYIQENIYYTGSLYPTNISESSDKGLIVASYHPDTKSLETEVVPVVSTVRSTIEIALPNEDAVREMVLLDRAQTRYIIVGTPEDVAEVRSQIKTKNKDIDCVYDIRPKRSKEYRNVDFDTIIRDRVKDDDVASIFEEIMHM